LWDLFYEDPWWQWRWHHCANCDVVTFPHITRFLDWSWWWYEIRTTPVYWFRDMRDHKYRWVDVVPWWSLPDALWKWARGYAWGKWWEVQHWCSKLYRWYAPSKRAERDALIVKTKEPYVGSHRAS
jgi:hypothetical protein